MNLSNLSPVQLAVISIIILIISLVWFYIAARLASWGAARSWWEFKSKFRTNRRNKQKEEEEV